MHPKLFVVCTLLYATANIFLPARAWTNTHSNKYDHHYNQQQKVDSGDSLKIDGLGSTLSRRDVFGSATAAIVAAALPLPADALPDGDPPLDGLHVRDRKSNKGALIREDYWFMMGKTPPRVLNGPLITDDPEFNAFGSCETSGGGGGSNSCTYVSLKQRIPVYSKYGFSITLGAKEYSMLGNSLRKGDWNGAVPYLVSQDSNLPPPPPVDALLKMVLFASGMLTSPNYSGPSKRLLVARFYANEVGFAIGEIKEAIDARDQKRAMEAWEFGRDSFNSYFQIVNDSISPKVGDKFDLIQ
ncbi:unnamed protein product [Pseudo-nitzschia multistriata]|uniref:Uncharacterized protein n=1 Tax=Pseudo-nitzschia multistriata TaxID=183589 RepID=A0A448Z3J2_9STRA|nr:unnamed protein product [Pseudo-nitzschia multistriata]